VETLLLRDPDLVILIGGSDNADAVREPQHQPSRAYRRARGAGQGPVGGDRTRAGSRPNWRSREAHSGCLLRCRLSPCLYHWRWKLPERSAVDRRRPQCVR
jgi:hypothetical protein